MGKTSKNSILKRNDKVREFPKLGEPLSAEQQVRLSEMLGESAALPTEEK
jgi:hypothetical protein